MAVPRFISFPIFMTRFISFPKTKFKMIYAMLAMTWTSFKYTVICHNEMVKVGYNIFYRYEFEFTCFLLRCLPGIHCSLVAVINCRALSNKTYWNCLCKNVMWKKTAFKCGNEFHTFVDDLLYWTVSCLSLFVEHDFIQMQLAYINRLIIKGV